MAHAGHGDGGEGGIADLRYEVMYFLEAPDEHHPGLQGRVGRHRRLDRGRRRRRPLELPHPHRRHRRRRSRPPSTSAGPARSGSPTCSSRSRRSAGSARPSRRRPSRRSATSPVADRGRRRGHRRRHPPHLPLARRAGHRHRRPVDEPVDRRSCSRRSRPCPADAGRDPAEQQEHHPGGRAGRRPDRPRRCASCRPRASPRASPRCSPTTPRRAADDNAEAMAEAAANVVAGEVTQAVRDSTCDVGPDRTRATTSASPATASAPSSRPRRPPPPSACSTCWSTDEPRDRHDHRGRGRRAGDTRHITEWLAEQPPRRRRPRSTTAASRSTPTSSASSRCPTGSRWPTSPISAGHRRSRGWAPSEAEGARRARDRRSVLDLLTHYPRRYLDRTKQSTHRRPARWATRRPCWSPSAGSTSRRPGGRRKALRRGPGHRRLRLRCGHLLQPAVAGAAARPGHRRSMLFGKARDLPGPAADDQPGRSTSSTGRPDRPDRRRLPAVGEGRRLLAGTSRSWVAEVAAPRPASSPTRCPARRARPARLRRPHRGVPRHPPARVDARGARRPAAASCSTSCCGSSSRWCCASASSSATTPGHRPRPSAVAWCARFHERLPVPADRRPSSG